MGSQSGCAIFETFSEALIRLAQRQGCGDICHVLDDFLMVCKGWTMADEFVKIFLNLCIPVVEDKTETWGLHCLPGCYPRLYKNGSQATTGQTQPVPTLCSDVSSQKSYHSEPIGEPYWTQFCILGSDPRQALPEKVIQPKGRQEKKTATLQTTSVYRNKARPQHLGDLPIRMQWDYHVWRQPYDDNRGEGHPGIHITMRLEG